jgi:hypothetical protein
MKILFSILLTGILFVAKAQVFSPTSFKTDGYPVSAGFPAKINKSINPTASDTMLTVTSSNGGITYALTASRVKTEEMANRSIAGIVARLEKKATKIESKISSTIAGKSATLIKYVNDKGTNITLQLFSEGRFVYQAFILDKNSFTSDAQANQYFNSVLLERPAATPISTSVAVVAPTTAIAAKSPTSTWAVNDRAEIFDTKENKWFGCLILKANPNGTYKIGYDGYADTYDEDVASDRLNKPTANTMPVKPSYVKAIKGQTVTIQGNLKAGEIMEDLEWAESSSMACWVGLRNVEFQGNHVAYWFDLPKKSIVKITVTSASTNSRINIYGYSGFDFIKTPPEVSRCTSCEASFPEWIGQPNLAEPAKPQTIEFNATTIRNRVYVAVAGARGVTSGAYTIAIELK